MAKTIATATTKKASAIGDVPLTSIPVLKRRTIKKRIAPLIPTPNPKKVKMKIAMVKKEVWDVLPI